MDTANANCLFQLAMLIATVWKVATPRGSSGPIYAGEAFLMTIFGVGGGFSVFTTALITQASGIGSTRLAELGRQGLLVAYAAFSAWFWLKGIDSLVRRLHSATIGSKR